MTTLASHRHTTRLLLLALAACEPTTSTFSKKHQAEYPPAPDDIVANSISSTSLGGEGATWVMVSQASFDAALALTSAAQRVSTPEMVANLQSASALANDNWTAGIFATMTYPQNISSRYWVVAQNPGVDSTGTYMIATSFKLAIIDLNIPKSQWFGAFARIAKRPFGGFDTGRCCGNTMVCQAEGGIGPCGQALCADTLHVKPQLLAALVAGNRLAPRETIAFSGGEPMQPIFCLPKLLPGCANMTHACDNGFFINPSQSWEASSSQPTCTGTIIERPLSGRTVPEYCQYASYGGGFISQIGTRHAGGIAPADCDGRCFSCETTNTAVDANGRPRACNLMKPVAGGGACEADDAIRQVNQSAAQAEWLARGGNSASPLVCEPASQTGVKACVDCSGGTCRNTVRVDAIPPNQRIVSICTMHPCPGGSAIIGPAPDATIAPRATLAVTGVPGLPRAARPAATAGRMLDTVDALPSQVPQVAGARPKHPIAEGEVKNKNPNETEAPPPQQIAQQNPATGADPVNMMAGSLEVSHTDLSFAGPARPLSFTRVYSSQGTSRSELGSNWSHNWDVRLIALRHENLPDGIDPFCAGTPEDVTCVMLREGLSAKLYMRDARDGLYKPQAGEFGTVLKDDTGWVLRQPDGHLRQFDTDGYLTYDADRFGNGFRLEYELNAWGRLDEALCANAVVRLNPMPGSWVVPVGPTGYLANSVTCSLLAGLVGRTKPLVKNPSLPPGANDFVLPANASTALQNARSLLLASQADGIGNGSPWGQRKKRVTRVVENHGPGETARELLFSYWPDTDTSAVPGANNIARAGLLRRVTGPAGAQVDFAYVAPAIPSRLREVLLASAVRADVGTQPAGLVAAPTRSYSFTYANAAVAGTTLTPAQVNDLRTRYDNYTSTVTGCSFVRFDRCGNPLVPLFVAKIDSLTDQHVDAFLSDVADNLLKISTPSDTVETRFETNPLSYSFDKVVSQRWGSSFVTGSPSTAPNWTTTLPQAAFSYLDEGPNGSDAFLDSSLRTRYAYEVVPASVVAESTRKRLTLPPDSVDGGVTPPGQLLTGATAVGGVGQCKPDHEPMRRTFLPGYRPTFDYYEPTLAPAPALDALTDGLVTAGVDLAMQLKRTRLTCAQLAEAQTFDAAHNDLQTSFTAKTGTGVFGTTFTQQSFVGRRSEMNANANRICAWTKYVDRMGVEHVYGFNYHGRTLVDAMKVAGVWKVGETLYNADGNVVSQRRVTSGNTAWTPNDGDTRYGYVEGALINQQGALHFQEPAPWYWAQRGNVSAILHRPRGGSVIDEIEGTSNTETTVARYTLLEYEPLFAQVSKVVQGDVLGGSPPTRRPRTTSTYFFDYQECSASTPDCLQPLLKDAQVWGAQLPVDGAGNVVLSPNPLSVLIGTGDLNGDGKVGAPARGTVVRSDTSSGTMLESSLYRSNAHGRLFMVQSPDGRVAGLDYLPFGALTGPGAQHGRGALARVRVLRKRETGSAYGPPQAPCPELPGPFRWLLPATCGATGLEDQLQVATGMSAAMASEIVREARSSTAEHASTTRYEYSVIGEVAKTLHADGSEIRFVRDVDGRVREEALFETPTQLHSRVVTTRDAQGLPVQLEKLNRTGGSLGTTFQSWDEEGHLLHRCHELNPGGCAAPRGALPTAGSQETYWYDKEGRLSVTMDAEGAYTTLGRDERGWVTTVTRSAAGETSRLTTMVLNDDGQWTTRGSGAIGGAFIIAQTRSFDGLGRLASTTDTEGRHSTVRFTARDVLSSVTTAGQWTQRYHHDDFGRVSEVWTNGQRTTQYARRPGGAVWRAESLGHAPTYVTEDDSGEVAVSQVGLVVSARVAPADVRFSATATIRNEAGLQTNTIERTLDVLGAPLTSTEVGYDGTSGVSSRASSFAYDDNGALVSTTDAIGATSEFVHDLLGRLVTERVPGNDGTLRETHFTYDRRGALLTRSDPRGASLGSTVQTYTGFGEPKLRTVPGGTTGAHQDVTTQWAYDAVGRLVTETSGPAALRFDYLSDRVSQIRVNGTETPLKDFSYDALGRLQTARHFNHGLVANLPAAQRTVTSTFGYDALGRLVSETSQVGTRPARTTASTWALTSASRWARTISRPDGQASVERYDDALRLAEVERPWTGRSSHFTYNGGAVVAETHLNNAADFTRSVIHDAFGQVHGSTWAQAGHIAFGYQALRDKVGRVVSFDRLFARQGHTSDRAWRGYKYVEGGAIEVLFEGTQAPATTGLDPTNTTWAQVSAIAQAMSAPRFDYTRDVAGSVLSIQQPGQTPRFSSPPRLRGFQTDSVQLNSGSWTVKHDDAGRVSEEADRLYAYDDFHSLTNSNFKNTTREGYQYDALGRLVAVWDATSWSMNEELAYDGQQMLAAWNAAGNVTWSATWGQGIDNLIAVRQASDGREAFALKDTSGSVVGYYRAEGSSPGLWLSADYTPEGRVNWKNWDSQSTCNESSSSSRCARMGGMPFGFHSSYKSPTNGLLYFRNRWYSAESAQWLSHDPLGEVDSPNLYAFNRFDAVNHWDPLGLDAEGPVRELETGADLLLQKQSSFDENLFDRLLYEFGYYDDHATDGKGANLGRRCQTALCEGADLVWNTSALGIVVASPLKTKGMSVTPDQEDELENHRLNPAFAPLESGELARQAWARDDKALAVVRAVRTAKETVDVVLAAVTVTKLLRIPRPTPKTPTAANNQTTVAPSSPTEPTAPQIAAPPVEAAKGPGSGLTRQTVEQLQKSRLSLEKKIQEHQQKLADYRRDPFAFDNKGTLRNAPAELRPKIIEGRIKVLEQQISKQLGELQKVMDLLGGGR